MVIRDKKFRKFLQEDEIQKAVRRLGRAIKKDYKDRDPLIVSVLNGSFIFAADLIRQLNRNTRITFIKVASYSELQSTGNVRQLIGLNENIFNQDIIILEDIIDSGQTITKMIDLVEDLGARSVEVVSLLRKPQNPAMQDRIKYVGFDIPEAFVVGYGLDYDGLGRNLKDIYQLN